MAMDRGHLRSPMSAARGRSALTLWLAVVLALAAKAAAGFSCRPGSRPVVFNFGDSNSDTGGMAVAMGWHIRPPEGRVFFHHPTGRFCDGRLAVDFLCEPLRSFPLPPASIRAASPLKTAFIKIPLFSFLQWSFVCYDFAHTTEKPRTHSAKKEQSSKQ
ncbi:hypothetical protein ABZP36_028066 [Zizania latifolia]